MFAFKPHLLDELKGLTKELFPDIVDFAYADDSHAKEIINKIRSRELDFENLSATEFRYCYQLSGLCRSDELKLLRRIAAARFNTEVFKIGWLYTQVNPDNKNAVLLFEDVCEHLTDTKNSTFNNSLIGTFNVKFSDIADIIWELLQKSKLDLKEFCKHYHINRKSQFYNQVVLSYLCKAPKEILIKYQEALIGYVKTQDLEFLRKPLENFTTVLEIDEMSDEFLEVLSERLIQEDSRETLGVSQKVLEYIRGAKFCAMLKEKVSTVKLDVYSSISGSIHDVKFLANDYVAIKFGKYIVLDHPTWDDEAIALAHNVYNAKYEEWVKRDFTADYWLEDEDRATARDIILEIKHTPTITLVFTGFDRLFTKDLLTVYK